MKEETQNNELIKLMREVYLKMGDYVEKQEYLEKEIKNQNLFINNLNEQIKNQSSQIADQKKKMLEKDEEIEDLSNAAITLAHEIKSINDNIILSTKNANRSGRPPLTDKEIDKIRELLKMGCTQREVAKEVDCSVGAVNKYKNQTAFDNKLPEESHVFSNGKQEIPRERPPIKSRGNFNSDF